MTMKFYILDAAGTYYNCTDKMQMKAESEKGEDTDE